MTPEEIQRKLAEYREIGRATFDRPTPKPAVQPLDRGTMGTILHCPDCGERMAGIPHWELVDEHFGCAGCGKVYYECDGRLWPCKFPEQDVPGWHLKHELPPKARTCQGTTQKSCSRHFRTPPGNEGAG